MKYNLKHILPFIILMEENEGIIGKAPSYINEKFQLCEDYYDDAYRALDKNNSAKLLRWLREWKATDLYSPDQLKEIEMQAGEWTGKEIDTATGKATLVVNYTVADAESDGVLLRIGYLGFKNMKLPVMISDMSGLATDYKECKERSREEWQEIISKGLEMLQKADEGSPAHSGLRVIEEGKLWVIQDGAAVTFLRPDDY